MRLAGACSPRWQVWFWFSLRWKVLGKGRILLCSGKLWEFGTFPLTPLPRWLTCGISPTGVFVIREPAESRQPVLQPRCVPRHMRCPCVPWIFRVRCKVQHSAALFSPSRLPSGAFFASSAQVSDSTALADGQHFDKQCDVDVIDTRLCCKRLLNPSPCFFFFLLRSVPIRYIGTISNSKFIMVSRNNWLVDHAFWGIIKLEYQTRGNWEFLNYKLVLRLLLCDMLLRASLASNTYVIDT